MAILGPNGEILETGSDKAVIPVAAGATLQLRVDKDGTVLETPSAFLVFEPGEWIILPMQIWQNALRKLMIAGTKDPAQPGIPRAERRRRARDLRN